MLPTPPEGLVPADAADRGAIDVSVVTVTWNSAPVLPGLLASLRDHPPTGRWELIVVDNGSRDGTPALVREQAPWAHLVANAANRGLPAANNQGMAVATGATLLICNPDVRVGPGAIAALQQLLAAHPRAGLAIPRLEYEDGALQTSAGDLPSLGDALLGRQWHRRTKPDAGFWWDGWPHDVEREIGRGHEAAYLVRADLVRDIGGQDEGFVLDWEGIDWTASARDAGWEVWFTPAARIVHLGGASIRQVPVRWVVRSHRGMYRYFAKRSARVVRPFLFLAVAARGAVKLVGLPLRATSYARGHRAPTDPTAAP